MEGVLTGERAALAADVRVKLQKSLDGYHTGLQVSVLNIPNARPPQEVREAFDDAVSAREDKDRIESEAEAYASQVVPEARGDAARIRAQAQGYKEASIARAQGDSERSEEHTSELQSLMRSPYAVFCLNKKHNRSRNERHTHTRIDAT